MLTCLRPLTLESPEPMLLSSNSGALCFLLYKMLSCPGSHCSLAGMYDGYIPIVKMKKERQQKILFWGKR